MKLRDITAIASLQYTNMAFNFGLQLFLTFLLAPEIFGVFAKIFAIREIFGAILSANLGTAVIYIKEKNFLKLATTTFYLGIAQSVMYFLGSFILLLVSYLMLNFPFDELKILFYLLIGLIFSGLYQVLYSLLEREEKFKFNSLVTIVVQLFTGIIVTIIAIISKDITAIIIREILPAFLLLVIYIIISIRQWGRSFIKFSHFDKNLSKEMLLYSVKMYFSRLLESIFFRLDILIASLYFNSSILGIYERVKYFASLPQIILTSFIVRVNMVKYSKNDDISNVQKTNTLSFILNFIMFFLIYFFIVFIDKIVGRGFSENIFPLFFLFFAYCGFGSVIENIKTYLYATNQVLKSAIVLRLLPIIIFSLCWFLIPDVMKHTIDYSAILLSFAYILPMLLMRSEYYKFSSKINMSW